MPPLADVLTILGLNFALCVAGFVALWLVGSAIRDVSFIDSVWALGMGALALSTWAQAGGAEPRQQLLLGLCLLWSLRLGIHLLVRWRTHGADRRYVRMMQKAEAERGWSYPYASLRLVFLLQAPLMWTVALPAQLGLIVASPSPIEPLAWIGRASCRERV